jgi:hypothetical protein
MTLLPDDLPAADEFDSSWLKMARELYYQTIVDALSYATGYNNRFKSCGGNRSFDVDAARERARVRIVLWVEEPLFQRIATSLQYDPDNARNLILELLEGQHVERIKPLVQKLKHEGRIHGYRGPKPKEKPEERHTGGVSGAGHAS